MHDKRIEIKFEGEIAGEIMQYLVSLRDFRKEERIQTTEKELQKVKNGEDDTLVNFSITASDLEMNIYFNSELDVLVGKMCEYLLSQPAMDEEA